MNLSDLVPKFRIEIRRSGSSKRDPWEIAELAHTENNVTAKLPHWKNNPDLEHRVVPNLPAAPQPVRLDPVQTPQSDRPSPSFVVQEPPLTLKSGPTMAIETAAPSAQAAAENKPSFALPFKTGDRLQDKNVADHPPLHVAELNPDGKHGFNVEFPGREIPGWFVPASAARHFELFDQPKAAHAAAHKAPKQKPAARKPAAPRSRKAKSAASKK